MLLKSDLRKELKAKRRTVCDKNKKDAEISALLLNSELYKKSDLILFYAALEDEINVDSSILSAFESGKKVALPVCTDGNGHMKFYYINSLDEIKKGFFGVREPDTDICSEVEEFSSSICVVPGIAYDKRGYRLGYGKGYYDRFLKNYTSLSVGLCYNELIKDTLPNGAYDVPVDYIISEKGIFTFDKEDKNG